MAHSNNGSDDIPSMHPGFLASRDQVQAASDRLGEPGLPVEDMIRAAAWLESFSRGESGFGGLGEEGTQWLAAKADDILRQARTLAAELAARQIP